METEVENRQLVEESSELSFGRNPQINGYNNARKYILKLTEFALSLFEEAGPSVEQVEIQYCDPVLLDGLKERLPSHAKISESGHEWPGKEYNTEYPYANILLEGESVKIEIDAKAVDYFDEGERDSWGLHKIRREIRIEAPTGYLASPEWREKEKALTRFWPLGQGYREC